MHFHFDFSAGQILWTATFAAELVLLVVLLGRDRARRFPWFTLSIMLGALLLLVTRLLYGRMAPMLTSTIFLSISNAAAIAGLLVPIEVARRAFAGVGRRAWLIGSLVVLAIAITVLVLWGPWPASSVFSGGSLLTTLRTMQLIAEKGAYLGAFLGIEVGLLVVFFGRRFAGGWRSHPQQIVIGLSAAGIAQLAVRILWEHIATVVKIHTQAEYQHAIALRERIYNANNFVYVLVLVWWILWLWLDEPGKGKDQGTEEPADQESPDSAAELHTTEGSAPAE